MHARTPSMRECTHTHTYIHIHTHATCGSLFSPPPQSSSSRAQDTMLGSKCFHLLSHLAVPLIPPPKPRKGLADGQMGDQFAGSVRTLAHSGHSTFAAFALMTGQLREHLCAHSCPFSPLMVGLPSLGTQELTKSRGEPVGEINVKTLPIGNPNILPRFWKHL